MCDCKRVDFLKTSLTQIVGGRETRAQKGITQACYSKRVDY